MNDSHRIEDRLRRLPSVSDDSDWADVLRRASASPVLGSESDPSPRRHAVRVRAGARSPRGWTSRRLVLGGVGALVAVGVTATAVVLIASASATRHTSRISTPRVIRTASYTLISNTDGTATLSINPTELFDAAALQSDLAQYGITAKVTAGSFCSSDPAPAGFSQVVSLPSGLPGPPTSASPTITFNPSAIPAGAELSFGDFQLTPSQQQADVALINANSYTCTSTPPSGSSDVLQVSWWQKPGSGSTIALGTEGGGDGSPPQSPASPSHPSGN